MLLRRQLRLAGATAAVSFSRHRRYCFDAPVARCFIRLTPHLVGLFGWSDLSGWSGLSIAVSVGLLVWVTIVVTHGDLATDSSIKIFAGCWFGSRS